jgi:hypothetical protein
MKTAEDVRALLQGALREPFVVVGPEAGVYWPDIQCDCVMDERDELPITIVHVFRSLDDVVVLDPVEPDEHEDAVGWFYEDSPPGHWMAISTYEPNVQLVYATEQRVLDSRWHALDRALST